MCFCGGECEGYCAVTNVVYQLRCLACRKTFIGKTTGTLRDRVSLHIKEIRTKKGIYHRHNEEFDIRVLARAEWRNPEDLKHIEKKMKQKYRPKLNILPEVSTCEELYEYRELLKKYEIAKELSLDEEDPDYEDGEIDNNKWFSTKHFTEDDNHVSMPPNPSDYRTVSWNPHNYALLKAADCFEERSRFEIADMDSQEAKHCNIWRENMMEYHTNDPEPFDDITTVKTKLGFSETRIDNYPLDEMIEVVIPGGIIAKSLDIPIETATCHVMVVDRNWIKAFATSGRKKSAPVLILYRFELTGPYTSHKLRWQYSVRDKTKPLLFDFTKTGK